MKILKFTSENIKRLHTVEIEPSGALVQITGPNASGKTSVLDSIYWLLAGTKDMDRQPIRRGCSEATISASLGTGDEVKLKVTRKLTQTNSTLTIERADGTRLKAPQQILDGLLGKIAFDPLGFSRMKPKDQFAELRKLVKLDIDLDEMDKLNDSDFSKRTDLNREAKTLRGQADGIVVTAGLPAEKIDITELSGKIEEAAKHNGAIETEKGRRLGMGREADGFAASAERHDKAVLDIELDIAKLQDKRKQRLADAMECRAKAVDMKATIEALPPHPDYIDVKEVRAEVSKAVATNSEIDKRVRKAELVAKAKAAEDKAESLTANIEGREKAKRDALMSAKMPVAGLSLGKDEVLFNDLPFEQASDAEQLRASCAIAMAMNPELRVLRVRDGSLLDENGLATLQTMAETDDYQIWIERVADDSTVGIVMEDGHVKEHPPETEQARSA